MESDKRFCGPLSEGACVKDAAEEGAQIYDDKPKVKQNHGNIDFSFLFYLKTRDDWRVVSWYTAAHLIFKTHFNSCFCLGFSINLM